MSKTGKKLKLGAVLDGLGWNHMAWQHPDMPADASENLDFYIKQAQLAESAKFDTLFWWMSVMLVPEIFRII